MMRETLSARNQFAARLNRIMMQTVMIQAMQSRMRALVGGELPTQIPLFSAEEAFNDPTVTIADLDDIISVNEGILHRLNTTVAFFT